MGGRWAETTNAYDPAERSVAQRTHEGKSPSVLLDHRTTKQLVDLDNRRALLKALSDVYGDSWWVDLERIAEDVTDPSTMESDARRYFLSEIVAGQQAFVDALHWAAMERPEETIRRKERICLGFDGSKTKDATALVGCRLSDGHLFHLQTWERPPDADGWRIPSADVDRVMTEVFDVYRVVYLFADPWKWQDYIDAWAGRWPKRVVEFPTNVETRMDRAIERFRTAFDVGQITHDGAEVLTRHVDSTVVTKGKRKTPRDDEGGTEFYLRMAKKKSTVNIDTAVAAVLAYAARGQAVEDGWLKRSADPLKTIY